MKADRSTQQAPRNRRQTVADDSSPPRDWRDHIALSGGIVGLFILAFFALNLMSRGCERLPKELIPPAFQPPCKPNVPGAICKISMGRTGCSATIIGPVRNSDREISLLTAAHCIQVGQAGTATLKDGRSFAFRCVTRNPQADAAWLVADRPAGDVPFALLASSLPDPGSAVWHQGYGVDKPGNVERGVYKGVSNDGQQLVFSLNVSSGDSGGGIISTDSGYVLSPVCCTQQTRVQTAVYGAHPGASAAIRPAAKASDFQEPQLHYPVIILPDPAWYESPAG